MKNVQKVDEHDEEKLAQQFMSIMVVSKQKEKELATPFSTERRNRSK